MGAGHCAIKAIDILKVNHKAQLEQASAYVHRHQKDIKETGVKSVGDIKKELAEVDAEIMQRVKWWNKEQR